MVPVRWKDLASACVLCLQIVLVVVIKTDMNKPFLIKKNIKTKRTKTDQK